MVYPITKFWFYPLSWILIRRIKGIENIPRNKNFIIVSNHEKLVDPLCIVYPILKKLNKKVHFLSSGSWWFLGETICRQWGGCIPVFDRTQAYEESKNLINSNEIIGIFPEAGIKKTNKHKNGAVRLSIDTGTPILPIGIKINSFGCTLNIGNLVYPSKNKNIDKQTGDMMDIVYKLRD